MTWVNGFWFAAGVLCALGVVLLLLPALRAAPTSGARAGIPRWTLVAGAGGIALVVALYLWLGRPELIGAAPAGQEIPHAMTVPSPAAPAMGGDAAGSMDAAVAGLEARLAKGQGSDADWNLLAQSYEFLGRSADAAAARAKQLPTARPAPVAAAPAVSRPLGPAALKLVDQANAARRAGKYAAARDIYVKLAARGEMTADTWADYADVSASLHGGKLAGEPQQFIASALALDPRHAKALWLDGSALHETGHYAEAVAAWQRLAAVLDPASSDAKLIAANIAEDRRLAGAAGASVGAPAAAGPATVIAAPAAGAVSVSGEVALSDAVRSRAAAGLTLFIVAKSVDQPGMPVAVLRTTTGQWPFRFRLDDSLAMMPSRALSGAGRVTVEARISKTGLATPTTGDLQGTSGVIDPKAGRPLRIVIDRVVD
jgi:cytochrome c-type biogenesis protein CcmH